MSYLIYLSEWKLFFSFQISFQIYLILFSDSCLVFKMCTCIALQMHMWSGPTCECKTHLFCRSQNDFWKDSGGRESWVPLLHCELWKWIRSPHPAFAGGCSLPFLLLADWEKSSKSLLSNKSESVTLFLQHLPQVILPLKAEVGLFQGRNYSHARGQWFLFPFVPLCPPKEM